MKRFNLKQKGLPISGFSKLLDTELGTSELTTGHIKNDAMVKSYSKDTATIYNISPLSEVTYNISDGKLANNSHSGMRYIFEDIKARAEKGQHTFVVPIAEIRNKPTLFKIGHYCALVIRFKDDQWYLDVMDSKSDESILRKTVKAIALTARIMHLNSNIALQDLFNNVMKTDCTVKRHYYNHQQTVMDNLCSAFTIKLISTRLLPSILTTGSIDVEKEVSNMENPNYVFSTATTFLSSNDIQSMEAQITNDKEAASKASEISEYDSEDFDFPEEDSDFKP